MAAQTTAPAETVKDDRRLERLRWKARRGLLENDLLLAEFMHTELPLLDDAELTLVDQLLLLDDNDLLELLMGRKPAADAAMARLVSKIQTTHAARRQNAAGNGDLK